MLRTAGEQGAGRQRALDACRRGNSCDKFVSSSKRSTRGPTMKRALLALVMLLLPLFHGQAQPQPLPKRTWRNSSPKPSKSSSARWAPFSPQTPNGRHSHDVGFSDLQVVKGDGADIVLLVLGAKWTACVWRSRGCRDFSRTPLSGVFTVQRQGHVPRWWAAPPDCSGSRRAGGRSSIVLTASVCRSGAQSRRKCRDSVLPCRRKAHPGRRSRWNCSSPHQSQACRQENLR